MRVSLFIIILSASLSHCIAQSKFDIGLNLKWSAINRYSIEPNIKFGRFEIYSGVDSYYINPNKISRKLFGYHYGANYYYWTKYCKYYIGVSIYKMKYLWSYQNEENGAYNFHYDINQISTTPQDVRVDFSGYNIAAGANWSLGKNFFANLETGWTRAIQLNQFVHDGFSTCETGFCSDIRISRIKYGFPFFTTGIKYYFGNKLISEDEEK